MNREDMEALPFIAALEESTQETLAELTTVATVGAMEIAKDVIDNTSV
jgi:hypothetical protein